MLLFFRRSLRAEIDDREEAFKQKKPRGYAEKRKSLPIAAR